MRSVCVGKSAKGKPEENQVKLVKLDSLPDAVLFEIFIHLPIEDLLNVRTVSKTLRSATEQPVLWRKLTEINFGVKTGDFDCCYDVFKLVYKLLSDFQKSEEELAKQTATISSLTNNTNAEVSQFEEKVFRCILTKKEKFV